MTTVALLANGQEEALRLCGARMLPQVALVALLLGQVANAGKGKFLAYTNRTCEGDHAATVHSRVEVHAQGYLSYKEEGDDRCVDVSRWEVMVVTGTRIVDRVAWFDWPDSNYSSSHTLEWSDSLALWIAFVRDLIWAEQNGYTATGRCIRPVDLVDLPANTPGWVRNAIPKHHDVRTHKAPASGARETTTRGFFAVSMRRAALAAWGSMQVPPVHTGYVAGVIEDSAGTAGPCHLDEVLLPEYNRVLRAITVTTRGRYHLIRYNCQHWAKEKLGR